MAACWSDPALDCRMHDPNWPFCPRVLMAFLGGSRGLNTGSAVRHTARVGTAHWDQQPREQAGSGSEAPKGWPAAEQLAPALHPRSKPGRPESSAAQMVEAVQHGCMELYCSGRTSFGLLGGPLSLPQLVAASRHHVQAPVHRLHAAMFVIDPPPLDCGSQLGQVCKAKA